jgi:hypothetical protein
MATIAIFIVGVDVDGRKRDDEPLIRPYVTLNDGTVMTYKEWFDKGMPA